MKNTIDISFFGDFAELRENQYSIIEFAKKFIKKYTEKNEIFEISAYMKKFEGNYLGRPLVFCSIAANTEFGLVSTTGTAWGLKKALIQSLKSLIIEVQKLGEKELYGKYQEIADESLA